MKDKIIGIIWLAIGVFALWFLFGFMIPGFFEQYVMPLLMLFTGIYALMMATVYLTGWDNAEDNNKTDSGNNR